MRGSPRLGFRPGAILAVFAAAVAIAILGTGLGPSGLGWREIFEVLSGGGDPTARAIFWDVRLPRVVLAVLVGGALSGAGAAYQAVLRNPLADPFVLGVSGGAVLGAVLFLAAAGEGTIGLLGRPAAAFAGAAAALALLFALARLRGRTESHALLLVGVVVNAFVSAILLVLISVGDPAKFQGVLFFLVGSLDSISWTALLVMAILVTLGIATLAALAHTLNILSLGEEEAGHLGVAAEGATWIAVLAASLVTAAAVAFTGVIGFVGLIVPHAVRAIVGPDHRTLLPVSVAAGAAFLVLADAAARTVAAPAEIPVGAVTALLGGPFFLVLLFRRLRRP